MRISIVLPFCLSLTPLPCLAQVQAQAAAQNFVIVNFNAVVLQTAEAQREMNALQAKFAPGQAHLQALNNEIEGLRKQLSDSAGKLSEAEQASRAKALDSKEKQLQREAEDLRSDSQSQSQEAYQRVAQKVYTFMQTYAQQHGYAAIIDRGSDANPVVWYVATSLDITDQLLKAYNAQSGVAASAPATDPAKLGTSKQQQSLPDGPKPRPQLN